MKEFTREMFTRALKGGGVTPTERKFYEILAEKLEIQADGGDSAADFLIDCASQAYNEILAMTMDKRAEKLKNQAQNLRLGKPS